MTYHTLATSVSSINAIAPAMIAPTHPTTLRKLRRSTRYDAKVIDGKSGQTAGAKVDEVEKA